MVSAVPEGGGVTGVGWGREHSHWMALEVAHSVTHLCGHTRRDNK